MTDARLAPTFLTSAKIEALEDDIFWLYVNGLVWAASQESDGFIGRRKLLLLHPTADDPLSLAGRLVAARLWEPAEGGWLIHDFLDYQTSHQAREAERAAARDRKARERAKDKPGPDKLKAGDSHSHGVTEGEGHGVTKGEGHGVTEVGGHGVKTPLVGKAREGKEGSKGEEPHSGLLPMLPDETDEEYEARFDEKESTVLPFPHRPACPCPACYSERLRWGEGL